MTHQKESDTDFDELDRWQIEEIKKAIAEADRGEFASDEQVEQALKRWMNVHPDGNC